MLTEVFRKTKDASRNLGQLSEELRCKVLNSVADSLLENKDALLEANARDLSRMDPANPLYDRLQLTEARIKEIAGGIRDVASLPSPLAAELEHRVLPNGLLLRKVSVPFGVIGVIYEARPNVTFDVFALCFKSGNACILKGGKDAADSNEAAICLIRKVLEEYGIAPESATLLPSTHEATAEMLGAVGWIDVCIPRGGRKLIDFVRNNAKVPVIETGAGVVNTYFDLHGDLEIGKKIVFNAKTRRVSVCNALDCLIVHSGRLDDLAFLCAPLEAKGVSIRADGRAYSALEGKYPASLLSHACDEDFGTEFMDYILAVRTVNSIQEALEHIAAHGSGHSEAIVTGDEDAAERFRASVDAACVYVNAPTSFTDGAQFGLGAEIGISTQKLGPRGPMGLREMTTYKWLIDGNGQTRP